MKEPLTLIKSPLLSSDNPLPTTVLPYVRHDSGGSSKIFIVSLGRAYITRHVQATKIITDPVSQSHT